MAEARHEEIFNCAPEELYRVIADYESYPLFLSDVKQCRVVERPTPHRALVEYEVSVIKTVRYRLWTQETPLEGISWTFESGDLFKTMTGSWSLKSMHDGRTQATYRVDGSFKGFVPGPIAKTLLTVNLPQMMASYHRRLKELYGQN